MPGRVIYLGENEGSRFDEFITSTCSYIDEAQVVAAKRHWEIQVGPDGQKLNYEE
jgi:hypothetical protein